jgi:predicted nucleic acid-binding Zn ribbon protein
VTQKFEDPPLEHCPECRAPVKKLMSLGGFALKGNGWYTTDYKKSTGDGGSKSS